MAGWKPNDSDIIRIFEAHGLVPEGTMFEDALGLTSMYTDLILKLLNEIPEPDRKQALLAIMEEGLMQDGIIPNSHERKFVIPVELAKMLKKLSDELAGARKRQWES